MTLRARLALGFLTIALLLAVPLAASLVALRDTRRAVDELKEQALAASLLVSRITATTSLIRQRETYVYVNKGQDTVAVDQLRQATRSLSTLAGALRRFKLDTLQRDIGTSLATINRFIEIEIAALSDGELAVAENVSLHQVSPALDQIDGLLQRAGTRLSEVAAEQVAVTSEAAQDATQLAGLLLAAAVVAAALVAAWITRSISRPVRDLERGLGEVAGGNFAHRLSVAPGRHDEFGRLAASFTSMAEQLAELDKLKAEFVSVASHELKTPINVIMGYLKLLEEHLYGELNERQTQVISTMQAQADSMGRLVQHLLDVSRFEAGAGRLEPRPMNLRGFLKQLESSFEVIAMQKGVAFGVTATDALPEVVTWDLDRINEVLSNLLSNAFKFTEPGGRVDLVMTALQDTVYIEVRDTGVGMTPQQLPHIFEKFFQADNQQNANAKGTGLGLAIAKEIVEAHGGSIAAESRAGTKDHGTKFSVMLPIDAAPASEQGEGDAPADERTDAEAHAAAEVIA